MANDPIDQISAAFAKDKERRGKTLGKLEEIFPWHKSEADKAFDIVFRDPRASYNPDTPDQYATRVLSMDTCTYRIAENPFLAEDIAVTTENAAKHSGIDEFWNTPTVALENAKASLEGMARECTAADTTEDPYIIIDSLYHDTLNKLTEQKAYELKQAKKIVGLDENLLLEKIEQKNKEVVFEQIVNSKLNQLRASYRRGLITINKWTEGELSEAQEQELTTLMQNINYQTVSSKLKIVNNDTLAVSVFEPMAFSDYLETVYTDLKLHGLSSDDIILYACETYSDTNSKSPNSIGFVGNNSMEDKIAELRKRESLFNEIDDDFYNINQRDFTNLVDEANRRSLFIENLRLGKETDETLIINLERLQQDTATHAQKFKELVNLQFESQNYVGDPKKAAMIIGLAVCDEKYNPRLLTKRGAIAGLLKFMHRGNINEQFRFEDFKLAMKFLGIQMTDFTPDLERENDMQDLQQIAEQELRELFRVLGSSLEIQGGTFASSEEKGRMLLELSNLEPNMIENNFQIMKDSLMRDRLLLVAQNYTDEKIKERLMKSSYDEESETYRRAVDATKVLSILDILRKFGKYGIYSVLDTSDVLKARVIASRE